MTIEKSTDLNRQNKRYPLIVWNHLTLIGLISRYTLVPRDVVCVLDPAVACHELHLTLGEMNWRPA